MLAVGVTGYSGTFAAGDVVNIAGPDGAVVARGKTRFASDEISAIAGKKGEAVAAQFPTRRHLEVVHRDDMALL